MRKKKTLTLLEIVIAMVLLGILLTGLFNVFYQGLKKNISAKELKQKVLQLELFQHRMKHLFAQTTDVWMESHAEATGPALFVSFEEKADADLEMCGTLQGMLYCNDKKQLHFVSWSENGKDRSEILLDKINSVQFHLFDPKKAQWLQSWPKKKEEAPVMVSMKIQWEKKEIPCVFFLTDSEEKIIYSEQS